MLLFLVGLGFRAARPWMWATLAFALMAALSAALYPYGIKVLADGYVTKDFNDLALGVLLAGGLLAVNWTTANFDANVGFGLVDRVGLHVATMVADMVSRAPGLEQFEHPPYLRELDLIEENRNLLASGPRQVIAGAQTFLRGGVVMALLLAVHPILFTLPFMAICPLVAERRSVRVRQAAEERTVEGRRRAKQLFEMATGAAHGKEIRTFGLEAELARRHAELGGEVSREIARSAVKGGMTVALGWAVFIAGFMSTLFVVLQDTARGVVSPGDIVLTILLSQQLRLVLSQAASAVGQLLTTVRTARRLLSMEALLTGPEGGAIPPPDALSVGIRLRDVSFQYEEHSPPAVSNVNLFLPAGASVAIVGENGAGKSTIAKLLLGLHTPSEGVIAIDDRDLATICPEHWRQRVSAAFQDLVRFELSVQRTVGVGDLPSIDDRESVMGALDRAAATDVVQRVGSGLSTHLGSSFPDGQDLSGGQWQKLALARGMMRSAPLLLVLDEPTASLDAVTEDQLFERYVSAAARAGSLVGCITVLVTHRFSTVKRVDQIVVMEAGRVLEVGTHLELLERGGLYSDLFELQSAAFRD